MNYNKFPINIFSLSYFKSPLTLNNAIEIKLYQSYFIFLFTVFTQTTDIQPRYLDVIKYIVFKTQKKNLKSTKLFFKSQHNFLF